nr:GNAT family N-acetyltransferase [Lysobacter sp. CAU 1642]
MLGSPSAFLDWPLLQAMERSGCLQPRHGWRPAHLLLEENGGLRAAAPCYLKGNSHGEFVFDHGWAQAYERVGLSYYPKLLVAVPYSPVTGPRLLDGGDPEMRRALLDALRMQVDRMGLSSAHINFHREPIDDPHWLPRFDWQFHWRNPGWQGFDDFLAALTSKKRKNILQERRQVARVGIHIERLTGPAIDAASMQAMHGFYLDTFDRKGNFPALTPAFFDQLQSQLPERVMLALAYREGRCIAGAMFLFDADTLYGRYWGCHEDWPGLHFELCYYQGIEFCLERGIGLFEPGAQGEHKLARGFLPVQTRSAHYLRDPRFRAAVAESLAQEAHWQHAYREDLMRHSPYREGAAPE